MAETYTVCLKKDYLVFSAGHFITFDKNICERLHGHNYKVTAEVSGPLDENHYVLDFIALRDTLKKIVDRLDHRMLLPANHPTICVVDDGTEVLTTFEKRRWIFPSCDCLILPLANTTTELLARYIGHQLLIDLEARTGTRPECVKIEVDECEGQSATCTLLNE